LVVGGGRSGAAEKLLGLQKVKFSGEAPWLEWRQSDLDAIVGMFGYSQATAEATGEDALRIERQSNVAGGRYLFVLSAQRANHAYSMNEWQVQTGATYPYKFSSKLADDPGAIRIVSVTGRRSLTNSNISYVYTPQDPRGPSFRGTIEKPPKQEMTTLFYDNNQPYTFAGGTKQGKDDGKIKGVPEDFRGKKASGSDFSATLHNRKQVRFYFSFNHYRTIQFKVKSQLIDLNPWFAIYDG
jgi:hypothetical protein